MTSEMTISFADVAEEKEEMSTSKIEFRMVTEPNDNSILVLKNETEEEDEEE